MDTFHVDGFEYIDNLNFVQDAREYLRENPRCNDYIEKAKDLFTQHGWHGDGEVQLIWLPPFLFGSFGLTKGVVLWHVKQVEDGISWILSPIEIPYDVIKLDAEEENRMELLHGKEQTG